MLAKPLTRQATRTPPQPDYGISTNGGGGPQDILDLDAPAGLVGVGHVDEVLGLHLAGVGDEGGADGQRRVLLDEILDLLAGQVAQLAGRELAHHTLGVGRGDEGVDLDLVPGEGGDLDIDGLVGLGGHVSP